MNVFISIINFNSQRETEKCLSSIEKLNLSHGLNLFVYLLDNGSKEFTLKEKDFNLDLKIIKSEGNLGFPGGHNLIIKKVKEDADYILILNNDTILDSEMLLKLLNSFKENVGIVSPKIFFSPGSEFHKDRYTEKDKGKVIWYAGGIMDQSTVIGRHRGVDEVDSGQYDKEIETDFASGCCMFIKKDFLEKVGAFDERYFLYYEDADLSARLKRKGYKILFVPQAYMWHKNAGSSGGSGSVLQDYYITRNRLLYGMKFASYKVKLFLFAEGLKLAFFGRKWQKIGAKDFFTNRFGKGSVE